MFFFVTTLCEFIVVVIKLFNKNIDLCRKWLILAVFALALSGFLSIAIIVLRIPALNNLIDGAHYFNSALIIHVNLSTLVWMLSIASLLWSSILKSDYVKWSSYLFWLAFISSCLMACSIFFPTEQVVKNNYIPVIDNLIFLVALSMFGVSIGINAILVVLFSKFRGLVESAIYCSAILVLISCLCFVLSGFNSPVVSDLYDFYEYLFWGGGHILQFVYTQLFVIYCLLPFYKQSSKLISALFFINIFLSIPAVFIYFIYPADHPVLLEFFTNHMRYIGGLLAVVAILYTLKKNVSNFNTGFILSSSLFLYGGVLGLNISGVNVSIPAHYHGSIVGVTISLMSLAYLLLPKLNFVAISDRQQKIQLYIYSTGQFLHITGLAFMGGYGVLRKTAGNIVSTGAYVGSGMFFIGGLVAVIGGLIFVVIMLRAFLKRPN